MPRRRSARLKKVEEDDKDKEKDSSSAPFKRVLATAESKLYFVFIIKFICDVKTKQYIMYKSDILTMIALNNYIYDILY